MTTYARRQDAAMAMQQADITLAAPDAREVCAYVEDMAMDLAVMASRAGETALAASLTLVGIQAGAARRRPGADA